MLFRSLGPRARSTLSFDRYHGRGSGGGGGGSGGDNVWASKGGGSIADRLVGSECRCAAGERDRESRTGSEWRGSVRQLWRTRWRGGGEQVLDTAADRPRPRTPLASGGRVHLCRAVLELFRPAVQGLGQPVWPCVGAVHVAKRPTYSMATFVSTSLSLCSLSLSLSPALSYSNVDGR